MKLYLTTLIPVGPFQSDHSSPRSIKVLALFISIYMVTIFCPDSVFAQFEIGLSPYERLPEVPCTQYTELGSTVNLWDWRAPTYRINFYPGNAVEPSSRVISSPFHAYFTNTAHLAFHPGEPNDYEPADGWELLYYIWVHPHSPSKSLLLVSTTGMIAESGFFTI